MILTESGPRVFEFNARFGDPEAQVYLPTLQTDLLEVLNACVDGCLDRVHLAWANFHAVCVIVASGGYPGPYQKGKPIQGLAHANDLEDTKVFHASTISAGGQVLSNGGRVLGVTAWRDTLEEAAAAAYAAVDLIDFEGCFCRRDIAAKALG